MVVGVSFDAVLVGDRIDEDIGFCWWPEAESPEGSNDSQQVRYGQNDGKQVCLQLLQELDEDELRQGNDYCEHRYVEPEYVSFRKGLVKPYDADHRYGQAVDRHGGGGNERRVVVAAQCEQDDLEQYYWPDCNLDVLPVAFIHGADDGCPAFLSRPVIQEVQE